MSLIPLLIVFGLTVPLTAIAQDQAPEPCAALPARPDTSGFAAEVATFRALPERERAARVHEAGLLADRWCGPVPESEAKTRSTLRTRLGAACGAAFQDQTRGELKPRAIDVLGAAIADLREAARLDPAAARVQVALGWLHFLVGDNGAAIDASTRALALLPRPDVTGAGATGTIEAVDRELGRMAARDLALAAREAGCWEVLESAIAAGYAFARSESEREPFTVLRGLWLAGSGRTAAAIDHAVRMPAVRYRHVSSLSFGYVARPGAFANDWIRSQALLAIGDVDGARHCLGDYEQRRFHRLPLGEQFWEDAGLIFELDGDPQAERWYRHAQSVATLSFGRPVETITTLPLVLGFPAAGLPHFTHAGGAFAGGSPFGYIAVQLGLASEAAEAASRDRARGRALDMCESLLRRGVRPDVVRALRGRLHLAMGCNGPAYEDLAFAHAAFRSAGAVDPGTSRLLGLLESANGRQAEARALLQEAVAAMPDDAQNWRQLGVALGRARQYDAAREAMERALELDPASLEGWYNLGVVDWKSGEAEAALAHLEKAWELAPGNERVQYMLQVVATERRSSVTRGVGAAVDREGVIDGE